MTKEERTNFGAGLFAILLSIALFIGSQGIQNRQNLPISSAMFPRLVAVLSLIIGIPLIIQALYSWQKNKDHSLKKHGEPINLIRKEQVASLAKPVETFAIVVLFVLTLDLLGTIISGIIYLVLSFLILAPKDKRNWIVMAIVGITVPVCVYLLFSKAFTMILPTGFFA